MGNKPSGDEQKSTTFFADASSRERDSMVAGGFAIAGGRINEVEHHLSELRNRHNIKEFHWADYRGGKNRYAYEELITYSFELIKKHHAALHIIIANFKGYRHKANSGEIEIQV